MPRSFRFAPAVIVSACVCVPASAALPVYGGPTFDIGTFNGTNFGQVMHNPGAPVNDSGTVVSVGTKWVDRVNLGTRSYRWDASPTPPTELGTLGTTAAGVTSVQAFAINGAGVAVGRAMAYENGAGRGQRAVRWDAGSATATLLDTVPMNLPPAGGPPTDVAVAINSAGTAVGSSQVAYRPDVFTSFNGTLPIRWDAGGTAATPLATLGTAINGGFSAALGAAQAINDAGTIVGYSNKYVGTTDFGPRAVRWAAGGTAVTELDPLSPDDSAATRSQAIAINPAGTAVGFSTKVLGPGSTAERAVRWNAGGTAATELGVVTGASVNTSDSRALDLDDAGRAVGYFGKVVNGVAVGDRAVRWDVDGTATELASLTSRASDGLNTSQATAVNASGIAVGYSGLYTGNSTTAVGRAMAWLADGTAIDLNTLIDPSAGWVLVEADGISDTGWVSGLGVFDPDGPGPTAGYGRAFVLQIPEPSSLGLGGLGLLVLRRSRRVRSAVGV